MRRKINKKHLSRVASLLKHQLHMHLSDIDKAFVDSETKWMFFKARKRSICISIKAFISYNESKGWYEIQTDLAFPKLSLASSTGTIMREKPVAFKA